MKTQTILFANVIAAMMANDHAAFLAKAQGAAYEKREEPSLGALTKTIEEIGNTMAEYRRVNDERLEKLAKGNGTADHDAKLAEMDKRLDQLDAIKKSVEAMQTKLARPGALSGKAPMDGETEAQAEYRTAFVDWMRSPTDGALQARATTAYKAQEEERRSRLEGRAAQVVTNTPASGGFALPEFIESSILRLGAEQSPMRQLATVRTSGTPDYKELVDVGGAGFEWVGETDTRNQTNTPDLAEIAPTFGTASARPQASEESLNDLFFDVERWLIDSAAEAIGVGEGTAFVSGNGTKKPTGFLAGPAPVATSDASRAFGTLQYFASAQAAAMPTTPDVFLDMIYGIRARYRANARWAMNKATIATVRKYKNSQNDYIWQPSLVAKQPDMFMGYPVTELEDMPVVAANAFPVAFGDFKQGYLIVDIVGMRMTRDEITTPGFIKFYIRRRVGGKLRNTQAIKLLKIAAA